MIQLFKSGLRTLRTNSQLMFVVALVIFFPTLFIYTFNQFVSAAKSNTHTVLLQEINTLQDTLEFLSSQDKEALDFATHLTSKQSDLKKFRIVEESEKGLVITSDFDSSKIGQIETNVSPYKSALIESGRTFVYEITVNNTEISQAVRAVESSDKPTYYIFTEHDFSELNSVLNSRIQNAYLILTFIFIFIICLAYWIARQINYNNKYLKSLAELEERDLFINSLAHEFRAPLTAIRGYASLIQESSGTTNEQNDFAFRIKESTNRLVILINDFLEAAKIQSGKLKTEFSEFDITSVLNKVVLEMKPLADIKKLELKTSLPNLPVMITSDTKRIEQILTNIISNSIKYTAEGEVKISLESNLLNTTIVIADTGAGINAIDQKKLFSPFVRVGSAEQNNTVTGSGLGMWITKRLVEQLSGEISLESISGVGTHVIIKFKNKHHHG